MKTKKHIFLLCNLSLGLLALASCTTPVPTATPQPNATFSPTLLPSPGLTPTPSRTPIPMPPTPTFEPTLPVAQEQRMNELLQDKNCKLPCYLGIIPGKTTLNEARAILENLGAGYWGKPYTGRKDSAIGYTYTFIIGGQPGVGETPRPDGSIRTVSGDVVLITDNDVVQIIEADAGTIGPGISTAQAQEKFREYWTRYTARGIFLQLGLPDHLYTDAPNEVWSGSDLLITYDKIGVAAQIYGARPDNNICPEIEAKSIALRLILFSLSSKLSMYDDRVPPTDRNIWLPIEEVVGVNTKEFYNRVISDPSICFQIK